MQSSFHAVAIGRQTGVFQASWDEIEPLVKGYSGCRHKKFCSMVEAQAWLTEQQRRAQTQDAVTMHHDVLIRSRTESTVVPAGATAAGGGATRVVSIVVTTCAFIALMYLSTIVL